MIIDIYSFFGVGGSNLLIPVVVLKKIFVVHVKNYN